MRAQGMASVEAPCPGPRDTPGATTQTLAVPLVVVIGAVLLCAIGLLAASPNTFADEAVYIELARHFDLSGKFEIFGISFPALTYGPAYAVLIAPIVQGATTAREAYMAVRGLNALLFASAAIPTFLIARRSVSRNAATLVAAAAIAIPASAYTAKIMTESLAYPIVLWAILAGLRVVERATLPRQIALLTCLVLATEVRFELLILTPASALACIVGGNGRLRARLRRLTPLLAGSGLVLVGVIAVVQANSASGSRVGAHGLDIQGFSILRFGALLLGSLGAIDLYSGVLPFGVFVLFAARLRRSPALANPELRSIILIASILGSALVATGSVYLATVPKASRPPIPPDRYTFYIVPLLFVVFAAWIEGGALRGPGTAWSALVAAGLPVLAALVGVAKDPHGTENGLAFLPWIEVSTGRIIALLSVLAIYGGACALLLIRPQSGPHTLVKPVLALVTITTISAFFFEFSASVYSPSPGWLDAHSRPGVVALWAREPSPAESQGLWEIAVANRNLAAIYFMKAPDTFAPELETHVSALADGSLVHNGKPLAARFVLTPVATKVVGRLVAKSHGFAIYSVLAHVQLDRSSPTG
jgi:hypothetical protein